MMNTYKKYFTGVAVAAMLTMCTSKPAAVISAQRYACPMHPQITRDAPGTCPICKMALVKTGPAADSAVMLTDQQILLGDIQTVGVRTTRPASAQTFTGVFSVDQSRSVSVSTRVAGRILAVFAREPFQHVRGGESLYSIYSEELEALVDQYRAAQGQHEEMLAKAALHKLALQGISQHEADAHLDSPTPSVFVVASPAGGVVLEASIRPGEFVSAGQNLFVINDLKSLWAEADIYAADTTSVARGDKAEVLSASGSRRPATVFRTVSEIKAGRASRIVASVSSPAADMHPGGRAVLEITTRSNGIVIPANAIIYSGKQARVWIRDEQGAFRLRRVRTTGRDSGQTLISSGLVAGDRVVVRGAFLLDGELELKNGLAPAGQ